MRIPEAEEQVKHAMAEAIYRATKKARCRAHGRPYAPNWLDLEVLTHCMCGLARGAPRGRR